mgnify:CR=1 FL=1
MNVCYFCGGFNTNGGIGRVTSIIAENLAKDQDIKVFLCSFYENKTNSYYMTQNCADSHILFDTPISMTKAIVKDHAIGKLIKYIKANKIEILVACGALYFPLTLLAARMCKIKLICWEHINPTNYYDYKFQKEARMIGTRYCDCNVVLTNEALNWYKKHAKYHDIIQIYNPVDPIITKYSQKKYLSESKKIISVGRLCYQKNFDRLVDIADEVLKKYPDWSWDIYGEGEERIALEEKIRRYNLQEKVTLKGQVHNIYELYHQYSMIVMTSRYEGFPMVLLEAAACGLPMVSFDIQTGPSEIIKNGVNGYLCNKNSNSEMINNIISLIGSEENRKEFSYNSKKTAESFSVDSICEQWKKLFKRII